MIDSGSDRRGSAGDSVDVPAVAPVPAESPAAAGAVGAVQDSTEADLISAAVLTVTDIAGLSAGPFGEIASYLPGRSVPGVRIDDERVEVHIVARYGRPLQEIADELARAVRHVLAGRPLQVSVDDILLPGEQLAEAVPISSRTEA